MVIGKMKILNTGMFLIYLALHPGREISPLLDADFANARRKTLEIRGDGGTGWSKAWKINFWARLLDGDHAYKMYQELLKDFNTQ